MSEDVPDVAIPAEDAKLLADLKEMPRSKTRTRGVLIDKISADGWAAILSEADGVLLRAESATGISTETIVKRLKILGVEHEYGNRTSGDYRDRWRERQRELAKASEFRKKLAPVEHPPELDPRVGWMVLADIHWPFHDEDYINRALGVADHFGYRSAVIIGDTGDLEGLSKFVERDRRGKAEVQEDIEALEKFLAYLNQHFDEMVFLVGNHELRLLRKLEGFFSAKYLFGKLLNQKFVDADHLFIGPGGENQGGARLIHRWRGWGRKALLSEAAEFARVNYQDTYTAHNHRYAQGWSNAGWRIGMLGGLFLEPSMQWRVRESSFVRWSRGFFVSHPVEWTGENKITRTSMLQGFSDGETNWSEYDCE